MKNKKVTIRILISVTILIVGMSAFYKFMTYDRRYSWSKELEQETKKIAGMHAFSFTGVEEISVDSIKLPSEWKIKISLQKFLHKINLMNYGSEFGQCIVFNSTTSGDILKFKAWCLSDHIIGLQVELLTNGQADMSTLRLDIKRRFEDYDIIWTTTPR